MESPQSPTFVAPSSTRRRLEVAELESPTKKLKGGGTEEVVQVVEEKEINTKEVEAKASNGQEAKVEEVNDSDKKNDGESGPCANASHGKDDDEEADGATQPELEEKEKEVDVEEEEEGTEVAVAGRCTYSSFFSMQDAKRLTKEIKVKMMNEFWSVLKARCGGCFLRSVLTEAEDQEGLKLIFRVSTLESKEDGQLEGVQLAAVTACFQTEKATSFTLDIINTANTLTECNVKVPYLKEAAEKAFETILVPFADRSGRGQGQMSANDIEKFAILAGWDVNVESP